MCYIIRVVKDGIEEIANAPADSSGWELARFGIIALLCVIPLRLFIAQPFIVSGSSMFPTFEDKNYLIVDELSYKLSDPERDDVIIFRYPNDTKKYFIKRIIGLPNETVEINGTEVKITKEGDKDSFVLDEPYVEHSSESGQRSWKLAPGEYFVMGDNRGASSDSRSWGPVPRKLIIGRAFLRLWPLSDMAVLPGSFESK